MESAVKLEGAAVSVSGTPIVQGLDLDILPGEHWVVVGPNGAGKTTLAKLIAGREFPTSGSVQVLGQETTDLESTYLGSRVGFASSAVADRLPGTSTVLSLVMPAAWGQTHQFSEEYEEVDEQRARDLLAALGIGDLADRRFSTLSEGEAQRVSIARALMADPEIVILDEPTAGLDLGARETLVVALRDIMADPKSPVIIMITHELEEIAPGFTHAALMKDGTITRKGPISEVFTDQNLSETFGLPLQLVEHSGRWWVSHTE